MNQALPLVCFAVKEEAKPFAASRPQARVLVTGMGRANAERAIRAALAETPPPLVLTCGFAGGLNPDLAPGAIVFSAGDCPDLERALLAAGARPARFHCAGQIACTAREKRALWETTGADAIEMESQFICAICREHRVPSATVRVILDAANDDLPLDFNQLLTPNLELDPGKLALALMKSPGTIPALIRFQKQTRAAAQALADMLVRCL